MEHPNRGIHRDLEVVRHFEGTKTEVVLTGVSTRAEGTEVSREVVLRVPK